MNRPRTDIGTFAGCDDDSDVVANSPNVDSKILICISDHGHMVDSESILCFSDGNISYSTIGSWIDEMDHSDLVYISGGNRSGLAGPELRGPGKTVICSMGADQVSFPDLFNITRGLEDPTSDIDGDGEVSYHEAYLKECYNLRFSDQDRKISSDLGGIYYPFTTAMGSIFATFLESPAPWATSTTESMSL